MDRRRDSTRSTRRRGTPRAGRVVRLGPQAVNPRDRARGSSDPRPGGPPARARRGGTTRPREAPRPERATSTRKGAGISLRPVTFVALSPEQERRAVEALAELLVPLLGVGHQSRIGPTAEHVVAGVDLSDTNPHPGSPATTSSNDDEPLDDDHVTIGHPQEVKAERSGSDSEQGPALLRE